jgi:maltooligosyltrehalose trehalohydrolase
MDNTLPPVGAIFHGNNRCTFCVWSPLKKKIELVLDGPVSRTFLMKRNEDGFWYITLDDILPDTRYFFRIDEAKVLPDPASRHQPNGVHAASAVVTAEYEWRDKDWKGIAMEDMIIYELHVGTFSARGDFAGVVAKLPYLKQLGINTIELMPLAQFPGSRNWGYDGVYPFAVQNSYGGPQGLKHLVDEAHQHGIAVILDVVYNHQGPEGHYFGEYAPYFSDKYKTFWGSAINFDDAYCDGVRHFYWQNALQWLDEFHIDGLRMDAVHAIWDFSAKHFIEELTERVERLEETSGRKKVLIAEFDLNNPRYINPRSEGGYGMHGQWIDEFHHALHSLLTGETDGYYEDFGDVRHLAKAFQDCYVYTGQYSVHRKKHFGRIPQNPYSQFVVFAQNHDQIGNRMLGDRLSTQLTLEGLKLAASAVLLAPHVPLLYMGEEYGEKNPFQYFISHTDEALVQMVREGRKKEFSYFKWNGEVPDPQSEETFNQCKLSFSIDEDPERRALFSLYKFLIGFRKSRKAMRGTQRSDVKVFCGSNAVIGIERRSSDDAILIVLNFEDGVAPYDIPENTKLHKIFDSASLQWRGPGELSAIPSENGQILLQPKSSVIFEIQ